MGKGIGDAVGGIEPPMTIQDSARQVIEQVSGCFWRRHIS